MPSVKYSLEGVQLKAKNIVYWRNDIVFLIEGILRLTGDIVVEPSNRINSVDLSLNGRNANIFIHESIQARSDFITSLMISNYIPEGSPSLSISSKLNDQVLMTTTSIQLTQEGNSQKITATFVPENHEIKTKFGLTLEVQMGCEFTGKVTIYTKPSATLDKIENAVHSLVNLARDVTQSIVNADTTVVSEGFWITSGTVILCILAAA